MEKVYLLPAHADDEPGHLGRKIESLWHCAGLDGAFRPGDITALKLHVGEPGRKTFVSPDIAAVLVDCLKKVGARPFMTDTAVLYKSRRDNGVDHAAVARDHGFTFDRCGAPFFPADGPTGSSGVRIAVDGTHFESVDIASSIEQAHSLLVLSHATGHLGTGFGGALKNLGMGCCTRGGKLAQHFGHHPRIDADTCTACGMCEQLCPVEAIKVDDFAVIDAERCIGCGDCIAVCGEGSIDFDWSIGGAELQERIVEHATGVMKSKAGRAAFVTVAMNITKNCDCLALDEPPLLEDIGILASRDPVALDAAVLRLVRERAGRSLESLSFPTRDASVQIEQAQKFGLGHAEAEIITLD